MTIGHLSAKFEAILLSFTKTFSILHRVSMESVFPMQFRPYLSFYCIFSHETFTRHSLTPSLLFCFSIYLEFLSFWKGFPLGGFGGPERTEFCVCWSALFKFSLHEFALPTVYLLA